MEKKVLYSGTIGNGLGSYELAWEHAALMFNVDLKLGPVKVKSGVEVNSVETLDEIAKAIPGQIDDAIIGVAKAALRSK